MAPDRGKSQFCLVSDDPLPAGRFLSSLWTLQDGPGDVTFANRLAPVTTARFPRPGPLRLSVSDGEQSAFDTLGLTLRDPAANIPPTVAIAQPRPGAAFLPGLNIPMLAEATDPDGTIGKVEFFVNNTLVHTDNAAPFIFNWDTAPLGFHGITGTATDDEGLSTTSDPVTIEVAEATPEGPMSHTRSITVH